MKTYQKNILWSVLYLAGLASFCFAIASFSGQDWMGAFIAFPLFMVIFTIIIMKDVKIFSILSLVTMLPASFMIFAVAANQENGFFVSAAAERTFMLTFPIILAFVLVAGIFWAKTKSGWKRVVGFILAGSSVLFLLIFGLTPPNYSENFVYTRIFLSILLVLSIYLIKTKKRGLKITGILGVILFVAALLFSALLFAGQTYTPEEKQEAEIIAFIEPKAKEMFGYYNEEDYANFCKYCGFDLLAINAAKPFIGQKEILGNFVSFGDPKIKQEVSFYYVEYPVTFSKQAKPLYLTFMLEGFAADSTIYGFSVAGQSEF